MADESLTESRSSHQVTELLEKVKKLEEENSGQRKLYLPALEEVMLAIDLVKTN